MDKKEFATLLEDAREQLGFYVKEEAKRRFVGETYPYLIKIPNVIFAVVALVATFILFTLELLVAGIIMKDNAILYGDLLLGFIAALIVGVLVGRFFSAKASKRIHSQIGDVLKFKWYEEKQKDED